MRTNIAAKNTRVRPVDLHKQLEAAAGQEQERRARGKGDPREADVERDAGGDDDDLRGNHHGEEDQGRQRTAAPGRGSRIGSSTWLSSLSWNSFGNARYGVLIQVRARLTSGRQTEVEEELPERVGHLRVKRDEEILLRLPMGLMTLPVVTANASASRSSVGDIPCFRAKYRTSGVPMTAMVSFHQERREETPAPRSSGRHELPCLSACGRRGDRRGRGAARSPAAQRRRRTCRRGRASRQD